MPCIKNVCSTIGKLLSAVVLGLGVSAVCFVPGVIDLLHTSARLESDTGLIQKIFYALTDPLFKSKESACVFCQTICLALQKIYSPMQITMKSRSCFFHVFRSAYLFNTCF